MIYFYLLNFVRQQSDPGLPGGDPDVPIDHGLLFLLVAAVIYGCYKIRKLPGD